MNYQLPKNNNGVSAASLSSMIDIIFLLIIFFVVTASFDREQLDSAVLLPTVNSGIAIKSLPPERLIVNILKDGSVKIGFHHLSADDVATKFSPILRSMTKGRQITLIVNADRKTQHRFISRVMESVTKAGYEKVRINAMITAEPKL